MVLVKKSSKPKPVVREQDDEEPKYGSSLGTEPESLRQEVRTASMEEQNAANDQSRNNFLDASASQIDRTQSMERSGSNTWFDSS